MGFLKHRRTTRSHITSYLTWDIRPIGRVVNWSRFKQGELVDQSRLSFSPTTVITDVITDLIEECNLIASDCMIIPLFLNGFTTVGFDLSIKGDGFQVNCGRRLVRGLFPLNPIAAEFGKNYDVLGAISAENKQTEERISDLVRRKYHCGHLRF